MRIFCRGPRARLRARTGRGDGRFRHAAAEGAEGLVLLPLRLARPAAGRVVAHHRARLSAGLRRGDRGQRRPGRGASHARLGAPHLDDARLLLLYSRHDFVPGDWPAPLKRGVRDQAERFEGCLTSVRPPAPSAAPVRRSCGAPPSCWPKCRSPPCSPPRAPRAAAAAGR